MRIDETMRVKEIMLRNMQNETVRKYKTDMQEHQMEVKESQDPVTKTERKQSDQSRRYHGSLRAEHLEKDEVISSVQCSQKAE